MRLPIPAPTFSRVLLLIVVSLPSWHTTSAATPTEKSPDETGSGAAQREIYKRVDDIELTLDIFSPNGHSASDKRPAIVFFFGGGWQAGTVKQFVPHCQYLASRGMVAAVADYRVAQRHGATPFDCVEDAKSAVRWLRANAQRLGIDPNRIAAGGGSAGGHLAAATATVKGFEDAREDLTISSRPNALILFNPVYDNGPGEYGHKRLGARYRELSPAHNIHAGMPPSIVFLGTNDGLIPVETAKRFQNTMREAGCRSELVLYAGQGHGFFNHPDFRPKASIRWYSETIYETDQFLASLGYLGGKPTLARPQFEFEDHTDEYLDVTYAGRFIVRYQYAWDASTPDRRHETYKPYLHVFERDGETLLSKGPGGVYTHHRGLFIGYSRLQSQGKAYDFWQMLGVTQQHQRFTEKTADGSRAAFTAMIHWNDGAGNTLLTEERTTTVSHPNSRCFLAIDFTSRLSASQDVVLGGDPEHAGVQFRPSDSVMREETAYLFESNSVDPRKQPDLKWVAQQIRLPQGRYSIGLVNHGSNPSGTVFSAYRDYGRFGAYPGATLAAGESLTLRYRWLFARGSMLPVDLMEAEWKDFQQPER